MSLVNNLQGLKDRLQHLPESFGLPQYQRTLTVCKVTLVGIEPIFEFIEIQPNPKIYRVPEKLFNLPFSEGTITLTQDDVVVENVSRSYPEATFKDDVEYFQIDLIKYRLVHLSDMATLGWKLILKRFQDRDV